MTLIRVLKSWGDDFYRVDADEDAVQEAVEELTEKYQEETPEDEWDGDDMANYILDGLEEKGFDLWIIVNQVDIDATCV